MGSRSHFMHQGHALLQNFNTKDYLCGGCKTDGNGMNFGCEPCNFHMHDFCSNCPTILSSFLHPEHALSLMISNTQYAASPRICDVCEDTVEGLFYWCETCNFSVHPLCTKFPQFLCNTVHYSHHLMSHDTTTKRLPPCAGLYTYGAVSSTANSHNMYKPPCVSDQTIPQYDMYNSYGGASSSANTCSMYNLYGAVPHGTYAHQPNNFHGGMSVGSNSHYMCHSGSGLASGTYHNGIPLNINSNSMYNPFNGLPCNPNPCSMYNPHNGVPFDSNPQHGQIHHGDTSHQAPAHNAQTSPAQGQGFGKLSRKFFGLVTSLALGVASDAIADAIF